MNQFLTKNGVLILMFGIMFCDSNITGVVETANEVLMDGMAFPKYVYSKTDAMKYLNSFGYMPEMEPDMDMGSPKMKNVLMDFQRFMGINESGLLDKDTMEMMNVPRCGVADNMFANTQHKYSMNSGRRFKRYALQGSKWETKNLTWKMTSFSKRDDMRGKDHEVERIMEYAFEEWAHNSNLNFQKETSDKKASIEIGFEVKDHRDGNPFDGPGRTLAHAFFPQFGGTTHFDDQEKWSVDGKRGVDLLSVAVHEFGHALGLGHSDNKGSLMYPTYAGKRYKLQSDDINGIEMLYGKRERRDTSVLDTSERKIPSAKSEAPDLCTDFRIDAADCNEKHECFFFRDEYIWRIKDNTGIYPGYPKLISQIFPGINGKVDSVFTEENTGRTFITRKGRVWIYKEPMTQPLRADDSIENIFRGLNADYLDASTRWGWNGKTYLFKENKYWLYEPDKVTQPIARGYPKDTSRWGGIPEKIDAAFFWPKTGKTYFFSGSKYYRFNDIANDVDRSKRPFPREVADWWLKCKTRAAKSKQDKLVKANVVKSVCKGARCTGQINESNDQKVDTFVKVVSNGIDKIASYGRRALNLFKFQN